MQINLTSNSHRICLPLLPWCWSSRCAPPRLWRTNVLKLKPDCINNYFRILKQLPTSPRVRPKLFCCLMNSSVPWAVPFPTLPSVAYSSPTGLLHFYLLFPWLQCSCSRRYGSLPNFLWVIWGHLLLRASLATLQGHLFTLSWSSSYNFIYLSISVYPVYVKTLGVQMFLYVGFVTAVPMASRKVYDWQRCWVNTGPDSESDCNCIKSSSADCVL